MGITWNWHAWSALTPDTLYGLLKLRSDIFVVEQNCVFSDMDGLDPQCEHLCASDAAGVVLACLRLVPPGVKHELPVIGRLVVAARARKRGLARAGMQLALQHCALRYPGRAVFLSGQQYLEDFYASLGFVTCSAPYLEDGIWHVDMTRA